MCVQFDKDLKKMIKTDFYKSKQYFEANIIYKIIDFAILYKSTLEFCAAGETLLDNRLRDFIMYGAKGGVPFISAITNGLLLEEKGEKLLKQD